MNIHDTGKILTFTDEASMCYQSSWHCLKTKIYLFEGMQYCREWKTLTSFFFAWSTLWILSFFKGLSVNIEGFHNLINIPEARGGCGIFGFSDGRKIESFGVGSTDCDVHWCGHSASCWKMSFPYNVEPHVNVLYCTGFWVFCEFQMVLGSGIYCNILWVPVRWVD